MTKKLLQKLCQIFNSNFILKKISDQENIIIRTSKYLKIHNEKIKQKTV